jgi:serine/threonine-protein kinase HipA
MPSDAAPTEAYVWVWLPSATEPVVAGVLRARGDVVLFTYAASYLGRPEAIALYAPELPLVRGAQRPLDGLTIAGCIADGAPDAWGQRVIMHRLLGGAKDTDPAELGPLNYLLESGSDRFGALDFQLAPGLYVPRLSGASLEEMLVAAERVDAGEPLSAELAAALLGGSSLGGARPKVVLAGPGQGPGQIAKFSSRTDPYPVVKAEGVAMNLAARVGLGVARTEVIECLGRDVLLVERFDRTTIPGQRRMAVSALTILRLDELVARYATYHDLADVIRERFTKPDSTLHELFSRVTFNICVGNTDDHARNHAAFWDGESLSLTPAYDICPQPRSGGEAAQAMAVAPSSRLSQLTACVAAAGIYHLSPSQAREIIDHQLEVITTSWDVAADEARLTTVERERMWKRQVLNPFALVGY